MCCSAAGDRASVQRMGVRISLGSSRDLALRLYTASQALRCCRRRRKGAQERPRLSRGGAMEGRLRATSLALHELLSIGRLLRAVAAVVAVTTCFATVALLRLSRRAQASSSGCGGKARCRRLRGGRRRSAITSWHPTLRRSLHRATCPCPRPATCLAYQYGRRRSTGPCPSACQPRGSFVSVVLIDFEDYPATVTTAQLQQLLSGDGFDGYAPVESLRNYYLRSSYGKLDIRPDVLGIYHYPGPRSAVDSSTDSAERQLVEDALSYFDQRGHDFSVYDANADGRIDYEIVYWTGPRGAWSSFWWGHYVPRLQRV